MHTELHSCKVHRHSCRSNAWRLCWFVHRSPWSNEYYPAMEDGFLPTQRLREMEIEANQLFDIYRKLCVAILSYPHLAVLQSIMEFALGVVVHSLFVSLHVEYPCPCCSVVSYVQSSQLLCISLYLLLSACACGWFCVAS